MGKRGVAALEDVLDRAEHDIRGKVGVLWRVCSSQTDWSFLFCEFAFPFVWHV